MRSDIVSVLLPALGFCGAPLPDGSGFAYTWPGRLGELLSEAEQRYGPRDKEWTLLGIQFGGRVAALFYPGYPVRKHISVRLSESCRADPARALFVLAHEVIHLLAPTGGSHALMIEEGLATNFSRDIGERFALGFSEASPSYIYARDATKPFLDAYPDAIRMIRKREPSFTKWTPQMVREQCPGLSEEVALQLCEPFADVETRLGGPVRD